MSKRQALEFSHAIAKPVDAPAIDLPNWLFTRSEADHAACRPGHRAIGGVSDGTRAGTVDVASIGCHNGMRAGVSDTKGREMSDEKLGEDFANLSPQDRAVIEGLNGIGLHHAPEANEAVASADVTGEEFRHSETDSVGTTWEPSWEPMDTYKDGDVVMLDDGERQILATREMGIWMELVDGDELAQPDYRPMLWSYVPEQVKYDMM